MLLGVQERMNRVKRFLAFLFTAVTVLSIMSSSVLAVEPEEKVIDLGDGFYAVETISQYPAGRSGDTVAGAKTRELYYKSTLIGTATLYASFDISGSSAKAISAGITGEGMNGCTYVKGTASGSGNTASGTATFKFEGVEKRLTISISCSPSGELS